MTDDQKAVVRRPLLTIHIQSNNNLCIITMFYNQTNFITHSIGMYLKVENNKTKYTFVLEIDAHFLTNLDKKKIINCLKLNIIIRQNLFLIQC